MRFLLFLLFILSSTQLFAIPCDCEVIVHAPLSGPYRMPSTLLKRYELEDFASYSPKAQGDCRKSCASAFEEDMPSERLTALLLNYSQKLIESKILGHNCTGLTTLKYPVRVKSLLGKRGLGTVADFIHVVNYEEICF